MSQGVDLENLNQIDKIFEAYGSLSSISFIGIPLAYLLWSFNQATTYHDKNNATHTEIKDKIYVRNFQKIILPLFSFINKSLREDPGLDLNEISSSDKKEILKEADEKKIELLKTRDYSSLEEAIELQEEMENILKDKKNQISLKNWVSWQRKILNVITINNVITIILGIFLIYYQKVNYSEIFSEVFCWTWTLSLLISFAFGGLYYYFTNKIQNLLYE